MKYLFRDRIPAGRMLSAFLKESSDTHPDHHDYHPHYELYFRRSPISQEITLNGETLCIKEPAVVLTAPFQIHAMSPADPDCGVYERHIVYFNEKLRVSLAGELLPDAFFEENTNCLFLLTENEAAMLEETLPTLFDDGLPEGERALMLGVFLTRLHRFVPPQRRRHFGRINAYIPRVLQYLYDHVERDHSAEEIAARFHVSRAKLNRDFTASVGQSLHRAVIDLRLQKAMTLLRESELPVSEVAARCGASSEYYFHAFFKRETGMTPLTYRRQCR